MDVSIDQRAMAAQESQEGAFLVIHNVHKRYNGVHALRGINVEIHQGEIYHLLGENGCGKSTLIKVISGAIGADEGELVINGTVHQQLTPLRRCHWGLRRFIRISLYPEFKCCREYWINRTTCRTGRKIKPNTGSPAPVVHR